MDKRAGTGSPAWQLAQKVLERKINSRRRGLPAAPHSRNTITSVGDRVQRGFGRPRMLCVCQGLWVLDTVGGAGVRANGDAGGPEGGGPRRFRGELGHGGRLGGRITGEGVEGYLVRLRDTQPAPRTGYPDRTPLARRPEERGPVGGGPEPRTVEVARRPSPREPRKPTGRQTAQEKVPQRRRDVPAVVA